MTIDENVPNFGLSPFYKGMPVMTQLDCDRASAIALMNIVACLEDLIKAAEQISKSLDRINDVMTSVTKR